MIFSRFFKTAKPKRFQYKPRYYDERKERMDDLKEQIRKVNEGDDETERPAPRRIREGFEFRRHEKSRNYSKSSNMRIVLIAVVLTLLMYYLLK